MAKKTDSLSNAIRGGMYDSEIVDIESAVRSRMKFLEFEKRDDFKVGDLVRFNNKARPTYLIGRTAKIIKKRLKKVEIQLDENTGRFHSDRPIGCPVSIIDKA